MSENNEQDIKSLYETILKLKDIKDCEEFFADLCTYKEIDSMAQRIKAAKMLSKNETYEQIIAQTDISSATLSRVSRALKYGKGYKKFIK